MADLVHVKGLADLTKVLEQLPDKLKRNVVRAALRAGMKVVQEEAQRTAPKESGQLAEGLKIGTRVKGGDVVARLKATGKHAYLAPWMEFGVQPHTIPGPLNLGGNIVADVEHPGVQPRPFLRPALDTQASQAVVAVGEYMKQRLATKHGLDTADITIEELQDDES